MQDHQEDLDDKQWARFTNYMLKIEPIVMQNEARALNAFQNNQLAGPQAPQAAPITPEPVTTPIQ